jgi:Xaa-Pro aminopeptidase
MTADVTSRIRRVQAAMQASGVDGLLVTPSADLRYLTGYAATPLERLTALVVPAESDPVLVVPALECAEAERSAAALAGMPIESHGETDDAFALAVRSLIGAQRVAVCDVMPARHVFAFQGALPTAQLAPAGPLLSDQRQRKAPDEVADLRQAAAAIDRVHARMGEFLAVGRTERACAAAIADAIVAEGHQQADFVIVGSGPNSASPHHTVSDRALEPGDVVVVDIGGTVASGYCSDSTRTYAVAREPEEEFLLYYDVLLQAQSAQCDAAGPGVAAEALDRIGRSVIAEAGYGDFFIHRTGHGIGLETHEAPYIVEGNSLALEPGMTFSIEPGIYLAGRHGARIEDIVAVTETGVERLNTTSRQLSVVDG